MGTSQMLLQPSSALFSSEERRLFELLALLSDASGGSYIEGGFAQSYRTGER